MGANRFGPRLWRIYVIILTTELDGRPFDIERASLVRLGMGWIELALWTYEASKRHRERDMG